MLPALAEVEDLAAGIPEGIEEDSEDWDRASWVLSIVSQWARSISRKDWILTAPPDDVVAVVLLAAKREYLNPRYVIREAEGPLNAQYSENSVPVGVFNAAEVAILERAWRKKGMWIKNFGRDEKSLSVGYLRTLPDEKLIAAVSPYDPGWVESIHT